MVKICLINEKPLFLPAVRNRKGDFFMYDIRETGRRIQELRRREGKTQEQAAADSGISVKTYRAIEQGQRGASIDTLLLLAEHFGVSVDFLVKGTGTFSVLDRHLSAMSREKQEKIVRIMKGIIRTLEW